MRKIFRDPKSLTDGAGDAGSSQDLAGCPLYHTNCLADKKAAQNLGGVEGGWWADLFKGALELAP